MCFVFSLASGFRWLKIFRNGTIHPQEMYEIHRCNINGTAALHLLILLMEEILHNLGWRKPEISDASLTTFPSTGDRRIYSINRIGSAVSPGCSVMCAAGHEMKAQYCGGVLCPKGHALILDGKKGRAKQRSMYFGLSPFQVQ